MPEPETFRSAAATQASRAAWLGRSVACNDRLERVSGPRWISTDEPSCSVMSSTTR